jgi:RimJ/RimL family protein N-acetyltransferase
MISTQSTERLILRPPQPEDLESLFAIYGDPATHQFNPAGPLLELRQAQTMLDRWLLHWAEKGFGQWAVATRETPACVIGFGGLDARMYLETERLNLGYRLGPKAWGQGYATELGRVALDFGFVELAVPEIFAVVRPDHGASIKVLEKIGMQRVDTLDDVPGQAPSLVFKAIR